MSKWEYCEVVEYTHNADAAEAFLKKLNELGEEGWELVCQIYMSYYTGRKLLMKREK